VNPQIQSVIDGFRTGLTSMEAGCSDPSILEPLRAVIARMEQLGEEAGDDFAAYSAKAIGEDLYTRYSTAMAECSAKMQAAQQAPAATESASPVSKIDPGNLELILAPHRPGLQSAESDPKAVQRKLAYQQFFALATECKTIPEFNRRCMETGLLPNLGIAAAWDSGIDTFNTVAKAVNPDMISYGIDALNATNEVYAPESIAASLNLLVYKNDERMTVRQSFSEFFLLFMGELGAYLGLVHSEEQRQKVVAAYKLMEHFTGLDFDRSFNNPYLRWLITAKGGANKSEHDKYTAEYRRMRFGFYCDAMLSPEDKQCLVADKKPAIEPDCAFPFTTGVVRGITITASEPEFAMAFDQGYPIKLFVSNGGDTAVELKPGGLTMWVIGEKSHAEVPLAVDLPAVLEPGKTLEFDGDLYGWGLPREEQLHLVSFALGLAGDTPAPVVPEAEGNSYAGVAIAHFQGGPAVDPVYCFPHRPLPTYAFPKKMV
jgi:hypothetical protein